MRKYRVSEEKKGAAPAYLSNGFMGFRYTVDTLHSERNQGWLSGFWENGITNVSAIAEIPVPQFTLQIGGQDVAPTFQGQTYDFSCGELLTEYELSTAENQGNVSHLLFCSRSLPSLLVSELTISIDRGEQVACEISLGASALPHELLLMRSDDKDFDALFYLLSKGKRGSAGVACRSYVFCESESQKCTSELDSVVKTTVSVSAQPGETIRIVTFLSYIPNTLHSEPHFQAIRELKLAAWEGYETIRNKNRALWKKIWDSRVEVVGAEADVQEMLDASYFYLMTSFHRSAASSLAPFALSSDNYEGHVFWDMDSFMFLVPLLVAPDMAENHLNYRFDRLDAARKNAKINGYLGAQYPWQSGDLGDEVTVPCAGQAGGAGEQHVNLDVAMAFAAYVQISGDDIFMREKAWPVIREVSDWITSRAEKTPRGYEILHVTGIDESADNVNNDSYTNIMAAMILRTAIDYARRMNFTPRKIWCDMADALYIPVNQEHQYVEQYENAPVSDSMKSESLMAFFPYYYSHSEAVDRNTFRFFLEHGLEEGLSLPMLSGFLGVFPAWLGERETAKDYYAFAKNFFAQPYFQGTERSEALYFMERGILPETVFVTARGSMLAGIMLGLTQMNFWQGDPDSWFQKEVSLPAGWEKIILHRVYIRGRAARIVAEHGKRAELEWLAE